MDPGSLERIAMYMVSLPCPPLPILVDIDQLKNKKISGKPVEDSDDEEERMAANEVVCSSHDILAGLILWAMERNDGKLNKLRETQQINITKRFLDLLDTLDIKDVDGMYKACQDFTAEYILCFEDSSHPTPSIRLLPISSVERKDKVHKSCCSWHAAQDIMHNKHNPTQHDKAEKRTAETFSNFTYKELIQEHCCRVKDTRSIMHDEEAAEAS
jgi:hypothetical protein